MKLFFLFSLAMTAAIASQAASQAPAVSSHGHMFLGAWPHHVLVLDEQSQSVIDRIDIGNDVPMQLLLSHDRKKLYAFTVKTSTIVTIDTATHKVLDSFNLDGGGKEYRLAAGAVDSDDRYIYSIVVPTEKKIDRFDQGSPQFIVIDLAQHKIVRTADYPKQEDLFGLAGLYVTDALRLSPDNKYLYVFRNNIQIFETADFKLVDTIDLAKPSYPGFQSVSLSLVDDPYEKPGFVTSMFVTADPIVHRTIFGIAKINLETRDIQFNPVGPYTSHVMNLWVTPDRSTGYTVSFTGEQGNKRSEFWVFDMKTNQLIRHGEFPGRRRFDFALSPSGTSLYIYVAGYQVDCYDPQTFKLTKSIDLNADATSNMVMIPGA
jgi:hypothetical protein